MRGTSSLATPADSALCRVAVAMSGLTLVTGMTVLAWAILAARL